MFQMIRYFCQFIFKTASVAKVVSAMDAKLAECRRLAESSLVVMAEREAALDRRQRESEAEFNHTRVALENAKITIRKLEEANDALRDQLKTANEITIPGLVQSCETMMARWREEQSIKTMSAAFARVQKENSE